LSPRSALVNLDTPLLESSNSSSGGVHLRILAPEGGLLFSCVGVEEVVLPVLSGRLFWRVAEGCNSLETYLGHLALTRGLTSVEEVSILKGHAGYVTLLGLGLLRLRVGGERGDVCIFGGIGTVRDNVVEVVTTDGFVSDFARPAIEKIPGFVSHVR
jgi:hypothetical protein